MKAIKISIVFVFVATVKSDYDDWSWPDKYTCEAKRMYVAENLVEDYQIWRTDIRSRIDYNDGAVKSIVVPGISRNNYGIKYEIHPESTNTEMNKMVCLKKKGTRYERYQTQDILPVFDDEFTLLGNETLYDIPVAKFYKENEEGGVLYKSTIWATYSDTFNAWLPVKYNEIKFNVWLGFLEKHDIWEFYNFEKDFDDDVFDTSNYDCSDTSMDDEAVTKHLHFINPDKDEHVDHIFNTFKQKYNKKYIDEKEHAKRRLIFQQKMRLITTRNRKNLGYKLAVNQFTDLTPEEMKRHKGLWKRREGAAGNIPFPYNDNKIKAIADNLPSEFDARLLGLVTPVKNQEVCGSCWTYGTTAALEGAIARTNGGRLLSLSNQALIDCAWGYGAGGCDGGTDNAAYEWMMDYGLPTEEEYGGYLNSDGFCHIENMTTVYSIQGYTDVTPKSVEALKIALINHGPVSTSVQASDAFSAYSEGIFYDAECSTTALDHEVTLVGYGEENGETFWILKNSWGPTWGIDGYMHISARDNVCGVATEPTYVVI